jgi:hypothetical protein
MSSPRGDFRDMNCARIATGLTHREQVKASDGQCGNGQGGKGQAVLARAREHVDDIRELKWYVLLNRRNIPLQIACDYAGAHLNPQVAERAKTD